jgi:hypothetical protein
MEQWRINGLLFVLYVSLNPFWDGGIIHVQRPIQSDASGLAM